VVLAGTRLARCADAIAAGTRLGGVWTGSVLLAAATSLAELATDVGRAARRAGSRSRRPVRLEHGQHAHPRDRRPAAAAGARAPAGDAGPRARREPRCPPGRDRGGARPGAAELRVRGGGAGLGASPAGRSRRRARRIRACAPRGEGPRSGRERAAGSPGPRPRLRPRGARGSRRGARIRLVREGHRPGERAREHARRHLARRPLDVPSRARRLRRRGAPRRVRPRGRQPVRFERVQHGPLLRARRRAAGEPVRGPRPEPRALGAVRGGAHQPGGRGARLPGGAALRDGGDPTAC
jgi:hypothetical protein